MDVLKGVPDILTPAEIKLAAHGLPGELRFTHLATKTIVHIPIEDKGEVVEVNAAVSSPTPDPKLEEAFRKAKVNLGAPYLKELTLLCRQRDEQRRTNE